MNNNETFLATSYATSQALTAFSMTEYNDFVLQWNAIVATPAAKTFLDANVTLLSDSLTITGHGYATGLKAALTTDGVLPTGLSATDYWIIKIDANTIKLATSAANALAGTAVDITAAAGGGTHTLTPYALTGGNIKMQESVDGSHWFDISGVNENITTTNVSLLESSSKCPMVRPYLTITTGQINLELRTFTKAT